MTNIDFAELQDAQVTLAYISKGQRKYATGRFSLAVGNKYVIVVETHKTKPTLILKNTVVGVRAL
jgi:hypothetical protein